MAGVWDDPASIDLAPSSFRCATDDAELTALVREQLAEEVPAAYSRGMRPFQVVVHCPGSGGHDVTCHGRYRYAR
jgi:hypothetical protein